METAAFSAECQCDGAMNRRSWKTNQAHLIKLMLSGNYLMEALVLLPSVLKQLGTWQRKSCALSKCLKQNKTKQTRVVYADQMSIRAYNSLIFVGNSRTAVGWGWMHLKKDQKNPHKQSHNSTDLLDWYTIFIDYNIFNLFPLLINLRKSTCYTKPRAPKTLPGNHNYNIYEGIKVAAKKEKWRCEWHTDMYLLSR